MLTIEKARAWYPEYDAVHGFDHILRVYRMCKTIGKAEGAQMEILLAAALLHDAQGSQPSSQMRGDHHLLSATFAEQILKEEGWDTENIQAVQHCIRAHRYRNHNSEKPQTIEAKVLFDADKLDVIGAIGVARAIGYAIQVQQPLYVQPSQQFLTNHKKAKGEAHSTYHEYLFKLSKIRDVLLTKTGRRLAEGRYAFITAYYEQLGAEMRGER